MGDAAATATPARTMPVREDCWTEEATATLIDAWGRRYVDLNRGNLRQKDWQDVADAVNALHAHSKKTFRTDVQCKNRIDTIKKKYKTEKARVSSFNEISNWIFFDRLDALIGSTASKKPSPLPSSSPPLALPLPYLKPHNLSLVPASSTPTVATPAIALPQKRMASAAEMDSMNFRRNYSVMAAAAAAEDVDDDDDEEVEESSEAREGGEGEEQGIRRLARAIEGFGRIYQRVEAEKQRQMVELEKQRMQFAKDLEVQRMQMFMNTQVQIEKIKRAKGSGSNDIFS